MLRRRNVIYHILLYFTAAVWLVNGLFCKLLNLVPRHRQIVAALLGADHAVLLTGLIGVAETLTALWIIARIKPRLCAITQVTVVMAMNLIEFLYVQRLLLFGRLNIVFAALLCVLIIYNESGRKKIIAAA